MKKQKSISPDKIIFENEQFLYWKKDDKVYSGKIISKYGIREKGTRVDKDSIKLVEEVLNNSNTRTRELTTVLKSHGVIVSWKKRRNKA